MGYGAADREGMTAGVLEADQHGLAFLDGEQAQRFNLQEIGRASEGGSSSIQCIQYCRSPS
jgi:hypothetical protein